MYSSYFQAYNVVRVLLYSLFIVIKLHSAILFINYRSFGTSPHPNRDIVIHEVFLPIMIMNVTHFYQHLMQQLTNLTCCNHFSMVAYPSCEIFVLLGFLDQKIQFHNFFSQTSSDLIQNLLHFKYLSFKGVLL